MGHYICLLIWMSPLAMCLSCGDNLQNTVTMPHHSTPRLLGSSHPCQPLVWLAWMQTACAVNSIHLHRIIRFFIFHAGCSFLSLLHFDDSIPTATGKGLTIPGRVCLWITLAHFTLAHPGSKDIFTVSLCAHSGSLRLRMCHSGSLWLPQH